MESVEKLDRNLGITQISLVVNRLVVVWSSARSKKQVDSNSKQILINKDGFKKISPSDLISIVQTRLS